MRLRSNLKNNVKRPNIIGHTKRYIADNKAMFSIRSQENSIQKGVQILGIGIVFAG